MPNITHWTLKWIVTEETSATAAQIQCWVLISASGGPVSQPSAPPVGRLIEARRSASNEIVLFSQTPAAAARKYIIKRHHLFPCTARCEAFNERPNHIGVIFSPARGAFMNPAPKRPD